MHSFNKTKAKMDILAFKVQEKMQCVSWYIQTKSTTTVRRNFHPNYGKNPPARTEILSLVENCSSQSSAENTTGRQRPSESEKMVQIASTYFHTHPLQSLRTAALNFTTSYAAIQNVLKSGFKCFCTRLISFQLKLEPYDYTQQLSFVQCCV